ncbi:MAG: ATP synthase F0 subunit B [Kiloniellales bacterium]
MSIVKRIFSATGASWIIAAGTSILALVALINFPPLARINELETRELTLLNRLEGLERAAVEAETRTSAAERQAASAKREAERIRRDAENQIEAARENIQDLNRQRDDLRRLVDLFDQQIKEKEEELAKARTRIDHLKEDRLTAEASFRTYVVGLTLTRVKAGALNLATVSSSGMFDGLRENTDYDVPSKEWPAEVWGTGGGSIGFPWGWGNVPLKFSGMKNGAMIFPSGTPYARTGRELINEATQSLEFQRLPDDVRRELRHRVDSFVAAQPKTFDAVLVINLKFEDYSALALKPKGTTGEPQRDAEIAIELKRQEAAHRSLAKALQELESLLLANNESTHTR